MSSSMTSALRVATDIGGTFTDLVYLSDGRAYKVKSHTTPGRFEEGVINAQAKAGIDMADVEFFAHGSTVVINALTERKGVKTGLITTEGFRDVIEIARGNTPDLFNSYYCKPKPFVPRYLRKEVTERVDHHGNILKPLDKQKLIGALEYLKQQCVEAIAVCFLHAYTNPSHEQQALQEIKQHWPEVAVIASHEVCREWREYERTNTAALSAYVLPPTRSYLDNLEAKLHTNGLKNAPFIMQSNGGIASINTAIANPITLVESGPVGGVLGALAYAQLVDEQDVIALDIGGTTAKCSLINRGKVSVTTDYYIEKSSKHAGYPIKTPVIDIVEIGNGGGSIAWLDSAGSLHVGPQSAGSTPGPVGYGQGGTEPTTTDANLITGRINPELFVGGEVTPDLQSVEAAFSKIGQRLETKAIDVARGVIRLANANMVNALKLVSINRGHDPREFSLMAFGGGGAMHACALAKELNIPKVIIPPDSGVFSAWGMLMIDLRRDYLHTFIMELSNDSWSEIDTQFSNAEKQAVQNYVAEGTEPGDIYHRRYLDMRYAGQEHTVKIELDDEIITFENLIARFHTTHEQEYTFRLDNPVEIVNFHLVSFGKLERVSLRELSSANNQDSSIAEKNVRTVDYDLDGIHNAKIYNRDLLLPGMHIDGPAIIEELDTTSVIPPGCHVDIDVYGGLHIHIDSDRGE